LKGVGFSVMRRFIQADDNAEIYGNDKKTAFWVLIVMEGMDINQ